MIGRRMTLSVCITWRRTLLLGKPVAHCTRPRGSAILGSFGTLLAVENPMDHVSEDVVVWFCDCRLSTDVPQL
jgi:hypothetical protein